MHSHNIRGVTLLELMIVIAVLGIITSIAIPAYKGYIKTSYRSECQNEVAAIKLAQEEYFLEYGGYFSGASAADLKNNSNSIYDPSNAADAAGHCTYEATSGAGTYTITAKAKAGGKLDGEGDIVTFTK